MPEETRADRRRLLRPLTAQGLQAVETDPAQAARIANGSVPCARAQQRT